MSVSVGVSCREGDGLGESRLCCRCICDGDYLRGGGIFDRDTVVHPEGESQEGFFFSWVCDYQLATNMGCFGWRD